jgi:hypothetical protein
MLYLCLICMTKGYLFCKFIEDLHLSVLVDIMPHPWTVKVVEPSTLSQMLWLFSLQANECSNMHSVWGGLTCF